MVRSVLYLNAREGGVDDIVDLYRRESILEQAVAQDGCISSELQLPRDPGGAILVTALWRDAAAYDAWVANPMRLTLAPQLAALVRGDFDAGVRGEIYDVVIATAEVGA